MTTGATAASGQREPELGGQIVVVIGGSAGIGLETARRARAEGADVILTGRNPDRLKQAAREVGTERTAAFDVNDAAALQRFFADLPAPIDHVMVTGGGPHYGLLLEMDAAQVRQAISDHAVRYLNVAHNAAEKMRPGGTLLFMGGTLGWRVGHGLGIVAAANAALRPFTAALALEVAPVRVNLIAAGFVDTPLSASLLGDRLEERREELRAADRPRRRACRHRCARCPHHEQHGAYRRDLRHRRRPTVRHLMKAQQLTGNSPYSNPPVDLEDDDA